MLTRFWSWTSPAASPGVAPVPFGPLRHRAWTTGAAVAGYAPLPFGPLRYHAWTTGAPVAGRAPVPFGALRYRAWTDGPFVPPVVPPAVDNVGTRPPQLLFDRGLRRQQLEEDEIMVLILAAWTATKGPQ